MRATLANRDYRTLDEPSNPIDYVAVSHRHSNDRNPSARRWRGDERALAFEDPDQPVEVLIVDECIYADSRGRVNAGDSVDAICGATRRFRPAAEGSTTPSAAITP